MIYLVRHGIAIGAQGRCIGRTDLPLSPDGVTAIGRLGDANVGATVDRIVASDLARAADSGRCLAGRWGAPLECDPRLRELDFGEWDGRTWDEIGAADEARLAEWTRDWVHMRPPGGESFVDLVARVAEWYDEWLSKGAGTTVVVAHAGSIRGLLCHVLQLPLEHAFAFRVDHARVSALDLSGAAPALTMLNAERLPGPISVW